MCLVGCVLEGEILLANLTISDSFSVYCIGDEIKIKHFVNMQEPACSHFRTLV